MFGILEKLGKAGLHLLAKAIPIVGTKYIKEKTGIDLDKGDVTEPELEQLKEFESTNQPLLLQILKDAQIKDEEQRTTRHAADMMSDSWLSKNVRPLTVLVIVVTFVAATFVTSVPQAKAELVCDVLQFFGAFYVSARTVDKLSAGGGIKSLFK